MSEKVNIVLNVNRSRINALGMMLAMYVFTIGLYLTIASSMSEPVSWVFMAPLVQVALGLALTVAAMVLLLASQRLDQHGRSEVWTFALGEILTYFAFALAISGSLQTVIGGIARAPELIDPATLADPMDYSLILVAARRLNLALLALIGSVWGIILYAMPALLVYRIPLSRQSKVRLAVVYVVMLCALFWACSVPYRIKAIAAGEDPMPGEYFARQFVQPTLWNGGRPARSAQ